MFVSEWSKHWLALRRENYPQILTPYLPCRKSPSFVSWRLMWHATRLWILLLWVWVFKNYIKLKVQNQLADTLFQYMSGTQEDAQSLISNQKNLHLLSFCVQCPKIAELLGVSLSSIKWRMNEYGFSVTALYSSITDRELDAMVSQIKHEFPNSGYRWCMVICCAVVFECIRCVFDSLHRVDPEGVAIRWGSVRSRGLSCQEA